jgi:hypothetical protein
MKTFLAILLAAWFGLILFLGAQRTFEQPAGGPPLPILFGATVPVIAFLAAFMGWSAFRESTLQADLRLLTAIQAWRAGGLGFLALQAHGVLPGLFAWPAGLGDIAIGVTAPWVLLTLIARPDFAGSPIFKAWNILGIVDLVAAVSFGALGSGFIPGLVTGVTTAPMAQLPLVLIPAFLVPLFIVAHLAALLQSRHAHVGQTDFRSLKSPKVLDSYGLGL